VEGFRNNLGSFATLAAIRRALAELSTEPIDECAAVTKSEKH
jgi:hypothetical protein